MDFFATTAKGMEALLADELRALGAADVEQKRAGASFRGTLETGYRACLWSRVANRVLLPLASFDAPDEAALYEGVSAIRWDEHLTVALTLAVDFSSSRSQIAHSHYGALRTKDAIVDQLRTESGERPSVDTGSPDVRVNVYLDQDHATVSLDLSGESLHRRGWRGEEVAAPLKENLAAAVLLLTGWPARVKAGESPSVPLYDPMCGSGTLPIEAALMATDRAPGLGRQRWGFSGWLGHQPAIWAPLIEEARARELVTPAQRRRLPPIVGHDADPRAVRVALANVERAGLRGVVHIEKRALADAAPIAETPGVLVCNPPYGERLGEEGELKPLYQELGDVLRRRFPGWTGFVLTGNQALAGAIGLRPTRRHVLYNGAIECRLLELPISKTPVAQIEGAQGPRWRRDPKVYTPDPAIEMFTNRLTKNLRHLGKWARREDVSCYRVYDADLPEYAVAVDLYQGKVHVQEYDPPDTVDAERATARLRDILHVLPGVLGVADPADVVLKVRRRQRAGEQYGKTGESGHTHEVTEGGHRFLVNLTDHLDTGLFLDHRKLRALVAELSPGRDFLNLFAYTATATVYAARAGARSTTSVDLSGTYLEWARRNLELNDITVDETTHRLVRADCLEWLPRQQRGRSYSVILCAPPTFSNSKGMQEEFDLQRDQATLLVGAGQLLTGDGVLLFSTHSRRFKLDETALGEAGLRAEKITHLTLPPDYAKAPRTHQSWRITRRGT